MLLGAGGGALVPHAVMSPRSVSAPCRPRGWAGRRLASMCTIFKIQFSLSTLVSLFQFPSLRASCCTVIITGPRGAASVGTQHLIGSPRRPRSGGPRRRRVRQERSCCSGGPPLPPGRPSCRSSSFLRRSMRSSSASARVAAASARCLAAAKLGGWGGGGGGWGGGGGKRGSRRGAQRQEQLLPGPRPQSHASPHSPAPPRPVPHPF